VICGRFALDFAVTLLQNIEATAIADRPFPDIVPTACAGVALFHSHYPFSEAYKLAEECCAEAKKLSRRESASFIDFQLHQSGTVSSLDLLRNRQYKAGGKQIIMRPWKASRGGSFEWFSNSCSEFAKWPNSKSKDLRDAIGTGDFEAREVIRQAESRGLKIPSYPFDLPLSKDGEPLCSEFAPYFDVLEFADLYERLLAEGGTAK